MVLPTGTTFPPLPYLVVLLVGVGLVAYALSRESVAVTGRTVLALSPWMVAGAAGYVLYQVEAVPAAIAPLFGSPSVYGFVFVLAGAVWLLALRTERTLFVLGVVGAVLALVPVAVALIVGLTRGSFAPAWPLFGLVLSAFLGGGTWAVFRRVSPEEAATLGWAGALAVFAHVLDGVSTAIGVDVLGFGEQTPLSMYILEAATALPTAPVIGVGWLFVLVKVLVVTLVVWLLADYVREDPTGGNALLVLVTAVGLGPGMHNVLLFAVLGPIGA